MVTVWVGSSILLGRLKVQWHTLSRWFANVEIKVRLLVGLGGAALATIPAEAAETPLGQPSSGGPSRDIPHRGRSSDAAQSFPVPDGGRQDRDHRTPYRRVHRALRLALAGSQNIRHPAV